MCWRSTLIGRLPAVELQPELRLTPPPGVTACVSVAQTLAASNAPTASFQPLSPAVALRVHIARAAMHHYTTQLQPLMALALQRLVRLPPELSAMIWSYLA